MLLLLPVPTLLSLQTALRTKVPVCVLCALGLFIVAITIIRLPINALHASVQSNRTIWASTELLAAAIAAHAPTIYGAFNHWQRLSKKGPCKSRAHLHTSNDTNNVVVRSRDLHKEDDEHLILGSPFQASVSSEATSRNCQVEEGIIMKTFEVSYGDDGSIHSGGKKDEP